MQIVMISFIRLRAYLIHRCKELKKEAVRIGLYYFCSLFLYCLLSEIVIVAIIQKEYKAFKVK